jgi:hypothetical protein
MHRNDFNEHYVDPQDREFVRGAIDCRVTQLDRLCSGRHRAIEGSGTVRADRAVAPGRFGAGDVIVALSPAEK